MTRLGAKCALFLLTSTTFAVAQTTATVTHSYNGYPVFIAIDDADLISIASIVVPEALKMTKVTVKVKVQYPQVGDLNLFLFSPDGTRVRLLEQNCGSLRNVDTTFDDSAPQKFADFCPAEAGRGPFRANDSLSDFNNADSSLGVWRLAVENSVSDDRVGWLNSYTLDITGTQQANPTFRPESVLNPASVRGGVIAPGESISIVGLSLGPQTGVAAPAGTLPTNLGGVRVTMNGTEIPLSYVSTYRIDGQVPFGIPTTGTVSVQVRNNEVTSTAVSVSAQPTFPGIYTAAQAGIGQAKAYNQNGRANSTTNPALRGEVVTVYASGLGPVTPAVTAGQASPSNPLALVSNALAASIGGTPATVQFAGLAPGLIGIYQVNIVVPMSVPAGVRDVVISNAGNASQGQVTIVVQ